MGILCENGLHTNCVCAHCAWRRLLGGAAYLLILFPGLGVSPAFQRSDYLKFNLTNFHPSSFRENF